MPQKRLIGLLCLCSMLLVVAGCSSQTVSEITANDEYLNESVHVSGKVKSPLKVGEISGYTLVDKNNDSIVVATSDIPEEGEQVTATGTLHEGILGIGYYIEAE